MPRGDKSSYTDKQKRMAEHIEEGYEKRGVNTKESEKRAWATVNKVTGGGKKSGCMSPRSVRKDTQWGAGAGVNYFATHYLGIGGEGYWQDDQTNRLCIALRAMCCCVCRWAKAVRPLRAGRRRPSVRRRQVLVWAGWRRNRIPVLRASGTVP
jgi:hypothetical protein